MSLIQDYLNSGAGAESTALLEKFSQPTVADSVEVKPVSVVPVTVNVQPVTVEPISKSEFSEAPSTSPAKKISDPNPKPITQKETKPIQTVTHPVGQTVTQPAIHTDGQTVARTVYQPDGLSTSHSTRPSDSLSTAQPAVHPVGQTVNQPLIHTVSQSDGRTVSQTADQTVSQTVLHPDRQTVVQPEVYHYPTVDLMMFSDPVTGLTRNQCQVLLYLIHQPGITQRPAISEHTGVPFGTVKDALAVLVKKGFISKPQYYVNGDYRGFSYVSNRALCENFLRKRGPEFSQPTNQTVNHPVGQTVFKTVGQTVNRPDGWSDSQTVVQTVPFSSKVFEDENLTTSKPGLLNEPELRFWAGEGVTERQVVNWMAEFQLSEEEIVMSLRYGRFDILERGDVQNSANWFYKIMTRNGFYPRPPNYRSLLEIRAEALQQQQELDKEAKAQIEAADFENRFQAFLADPDAPLYQELLKQVNNFAIEQLKVGERMVADIELRELFKKAR
jgi:hypothetical protein